MEFVWDNDQRTFRRTVREFLAAHLPNEWETLAHGPATEWQSAFSKRFCAELAAAGLLVPHWPAQWGGRDADAWMAFILAEEMWAAGEPRGGQYMNVNWIGPTIMRFGSAEQQARYIPPMAQGVTLWCQGFSEPESGSDLASLRTRAERDGEKYRITGQKIWTSYASEADTCFLLARTSPGRNGISVFLVPMNSPGITVRSIPSLIGEGDIHEVFFDSVEIPSDALLGAEGQAWDIAKTALSLERVGITALLLCHSRTASGRQDLAALAALWIRRHGTGCAGARRVRGRALLQLQHSRSPAPRIADRRRGERGALRHGIGGKGGQ